MNLSDRQTQLQIIRFLVAGSATTLADYGIFLIFNSLVATGLFFASAASLAAGFLVSFTLNRLWVFEANKKHSERSGLIQLAMYALLFSFNVVFTYYFIKLLGISDVPAELSKVGAIILITSWNFVFYKLLIFKIK